MITASSQEHNAQVSGFFFANSEFENETISSGVTVLFCPGSCNGTVVQFSGSPCSSQTDALRLENFGGNAVTAVVLTGGSMYGLNGASTGAFRIFSSRHAVGYTKIHIGGFDFPHVSSAALFDFDFISNSDSHLSPHGHSSGLFHGASLVDLYEQLGATAAGKAFDNFETSRDTEAVPAESFLHLGNAGAGMGAIVAHMLWDRERKMKGGLGFASVPVRDGLYVAALMAVNVFGEIRDHVTGELVAGYLDANRTRILPAVELLRQAQDDSTGRFSTRNTLIGVIMTNAALDRASLRKLTEMGSQGVPATIFPSSTLLDGDTLFGLSSGTVPASTHTSLGLNTLGAFAREAVSLAIVRAVCCAMDHKGVLSAATMKPSACYRTLASLLDVPDSACPPLAEYRHVLQQVPSSFFASNI